MIGNSPRSDINPALAAGLNAIFIPHAQTWVLEHEEIERSLGTGKLMELESFGRLREHF
jgi:putative hydrolase of the HAD superfamily